MNQDYFKQISDRIAANTQAAIDLTTDQIGRNLNLIELINSSWGWLEPEPKVCNDKDSY